MSLTKATYSMIEGAPANILDYGAVGDGVADDTAALQAALDDCQGKTIVFPSGTYKITNILYGRNPIQDAALVGQSDVQITGSFGYNLLKFCRTSNFSIQNITFNNQYVNAVDGSAGNAIVTWEELEQIAGSGVYQDVNLENVVIEGCTFTNPTSQAQALFIVLRSVQNPPGLIPPQSYRTGVMKNVSIRNNNFIEVGSTAITLMNRQTSTDRYTCVSNVRVEDNYFENLAFVSGAVYGMGLSLDGFGQDFYVLNNSIKGHKTNAIENVGWINGVIQGNTIHEGKSGTTHRMMTLDGNGVFAGPGAGTTTARVSGVRVIGNQSLTAQTFPDYVQGADNCTLSENIYNVAAAPENGAFQISNSTYITISNSHFISNNRAAVYIGDGATVTEHIVFDNCVFDNSASLASTAAIYFTGSGTTNNVACGVVNLASTGVTWLEGSSASGNSINNIYSGISGQYNPVFSGVSNVTSVANEGLCQWFKAGNMVTVSGRFNVTPTATGATMVSISLPAAVSSNISAADQLAGNASPWMFDDNAGGILGHVASDTAHVSWVTKSTSPHNMVFSFTYIVK